LIYNASNLYISNNKNKFPKKNGNKYIIELKDLVDEGLLVSPIKLSDIDADITNNKCIQVTYNDGYNFELKEKGTCEKLKIICIAVNKKTKTTGNIPQGNYLPGDEYICEVKTGIRYHFFVLSTEGNRVNLLMNRNIASDGTEATLENPGAVAWYKENDNTQGPVTAFDFLHEATKDWSNIENINMDYTDEENKYYSIITTDNITRIKTKDGNITAEYENLKVRMPSLTEVKNVGEENGAFDGTNLWMYNYLREYTENGGKSALGYDWGEGLVNLNNQNISGYWILASTISTDNGVNYATNMRAWDVDLGGGVHYSDPVYLDESENCIILNGNYPCKYSNGVRPVISINKKSLYSK